MNYTKTNSFLILVALLSNSAFAGRLYIDVSSSAPSTEFATDGTPVPPLPKVVRRATPEEERKLNPVVDQIVNGKNGEYREKSSELRYPDGVNTNGIYIDTTSYNKEERGSRVPSLPRSARTASTREIEQNREAIKIAIKNRADVCREMGGKYCDMSGPIVITPPPPKTWTSAIE